MTDKQHHWDYGMSGDTDPALAEIARQEISALPADTPPGLTTLPCGLRVTLFKPIVERRCDRCGKASCENVQDFQDPDYGF
jgi:hypothetical protein